MRFPTAITLGVLAPLLLLAPGCATTVAGTSSGSTETRAADGAFKLPFIDDDYDRALTEARARGLPIFIDAWAPW